MPQGDMNDLVNRALGGPAIDESLLMAEMYPVLEEQMQAQFDSDLENLSIQDNTEYLNLVVETIAQSNPAVRDVTVERAEAAEQNFNEFRAYLERYHEFPEAAEVDEDVALGSYYVRKKPPFFFSMEYGSNSGNASYRSSADPKSGYLQCYAEGGGKGGKGYASSTAGVGVCYSPAVPKGILNIGINPSVFAEGMALSSFCFSEFKTWLGIQVHKFSLITNKYLGMVGDIGGFVCIDHSNFLGSRCSKKPKNNYREMHLPVDSNHIYVVFAWVNAFAGGNGSGFLYYGAGIAEIKATVSFMELWLV